MTPPPSCVVPPREGWDDSGPEVAAAEPALLRAVNDSDPHVREDRGCRSKASGRFNYPLSPARAAE